MTVMTILLLFHMKVKQIIFPCCVKIGVIGCCFLLLISSPTSASFELKGSSARAQAMGLAYVGLANTPDAIFLNSSGLAQLNGIACSIYYTRPYGLRELSYGSIAATAHTPVAKIAVGAIQFGNELYGEQSLLFAISRSLRHNLFYGANLHYMKLHIAGYGSDFSFAVDAGFLMKLSERLTWGFFATNINRASIGQIKDQLPQTVSFGMSFSPHDDLILNFDIFKDVAFPMELRVGAEYLILRRLALRSGIINEPPQFAFGFGFFFPGARVDYALTTHQSLGMSHHLSLQLQVKSSKSPGAPTPLEPPKSQSSMEFKININSADEQAWQRIPGIGPKLARRIVEYRNQVGQFHSIEELCQVKGIGPSKLERIKPYLTLDQN